MHNYGDPENNMISSIPIDYINILS